MQIITSTKEIQSRCDSLRAEGKTIGLVPTLGYLHEGHLSLVRQACADNDICVVSIFVNPTQFGPDEDYEEYPRDPERDHRLLKELDVDLVFEPAPEEMYFPDASTVVEVKDDLTKALCGASRPTHFQGVTTVVAKLFNLVKPHRAYFGQKDAQQLIVIKRMVRDLNFDTVVIGMPTVREEDGLAVSSRNKYLSSEQREAATVLYRSLMLAQKLIDEGERDAKTVIRRMRGLIESEPLAKIKPASGGLYIDYVEIVDAHNLEKLTKMEDDVLIALAVFVGDTRLIDNVMLTVRETSLK